MDTKVLQELGFSNSEIKTYLALQASPDLPASKLASRAGINRTLCYQIIEKLAQKGLVSTVIKNKVRLFRAAPPEKLLDYVQEKEATLEKFIHTLSNTQLINDKAFSVELFEGAEGLKTVLNDALKTNSSEFLDITSGMTTTVLSPLYMEQWHKKRVHARINAKFLFNNTLIGRARIREVLLYNRCELALLPKGLAAPCHIYIYTNKVAITLWSKDAPFGIIIKSKEVHERFVEFFMWLWNKSRKIQKN